MSLRSRPVRLSPALVFALGALCAVSCLSPKASSTVDTATPVALASPLSSATSTAVLAAPKPTAAARETVAEEVESPEPTAAAHATSSRSPSDDGAPVYFYEIVHVYPHDAGAFTQGLVYEDGTLYEGTGLWGQSSLRRVDLASGDVLQFYALADQYFGEGITTFGDQILQLTWQSQIGFVYDRDTFELLDTFSYPTQGWGLTHDGTHLIMSDGTEMLHFIDPATYLEVRSVAVQNRGNPVFRLNELEYIQGEVYANVLQTDWIARIDPLTGEVMGWINLAGLLTAEEAASANVLNGIAYDSQAGRLFVTGKWWPKLFEIELVPLTQSSYLPHIVRQSASSSVWSQ